MKGKLKCIVFALIFMAVLSSCKKDFLQRDPSVAITKDRVFQDPVLASRFGDNSYNFLLDDYGRLSIPQPHKGTTGQFTDEAVFAATEANHGIIPMNQGNFLDPNATDVNLVYSRMYSGIRNANIMLSKIDSVPWTSAQNPKLMRAQQLFLRAMFYFELVKRFGGVILLDRALEQTESFDLPRNTYDETVAFILKDLQEAEQIFSTESQGTVYTPDNGWDQGNSGRPATGAAKALRARLLLVNASPLHNPTNDVAKWKRAADASKEIIDMNKYSLHTNYKTLLQVASSPEYIWIKVRPARPGNSASMNDFIIPPSSGGAQGLLNPTQNHVDLYEMSNGKPITDPTSGYDPQDPYKNRDPRFYANIIYNDMTWQGRKIQMWLNITVNPPSYGTDFQPGSNSYTRTRYYVAKLWPEAARGNQSAAVILNFVFFRYGEFLLNYAEALNEQSGPVGDVYKYVNEIRTRAGMPGLPVGLTKDQMRERIHNERAVELAFEEHRWWDILRWKKGVEIIPKTIMAMDVEKNASGFKYTPVALASIYQRVFQDYMHLYPIPRTEIYKSNGILQQNPGW